MAARQPRADRLPGAEAARDDRQRPGRPGHGWQRRDEPERERPGWGRDVDSVARFHARSRAWLCAELPLELRLQLGVLERRLPAGADRGRGRLVRGAVYATRRAGRGRRAMGQPHAGDPGVVRRQEGSCRDRGRGPGEGELGGGGRRRRRRDAGLVTEHQREVKPAVGARAPNRRQVSAREPKNSL